MKTTFLKHALAGMAMICSAALYAQPQTLKFAFSSDNDLTNWAISGGDATLTAANGYANGIMGLVNGKYRGDLVYTDNEGSISIDAEKDVVLGIKFIGGRPHGNLTFEINVAGTTYKWDSNKHDGMIKTTSGNTIYYYNLAGKSVPSGALNKLNIKIADATTGAFMYQVDWVATFAGVDELTANKDWQDDGETDTDEQVAKPTGVQSLYFTFSKSHEMWGPDNAAGTISIADGYYNCQMAVSGEKYRSDMKYNVFTREENYLTINPSKDKIVAIKFIGTRPNGNLKFEINGRKATETGSFSWLANNFSGPTGSVTTANGNTIYYFDLTSKDSYPTTDEEYTMQRINVIVADATQEPYSYKVDWIASFASLDDLEAFKNYADDGATDEDEKASQTVGIDALQTVSLHAFATAEGIVLQGAQAGNVVNVYNAAGLRIASLEAQGATQTIALQGRGLYLVEVWNGTQRNVCKVVK